MGQASCLSYEVLIGGDLRSDFALLLDRQDAYPTMNEFSFEIEYWRLSVKEALLERPLLFFLPVCPLRFIS